MLPTEFQMLSWYPDAVVDAALEIWTEGMDLFEDEKDKARRKMRAALYAADKAQWRAMSKVDEHTVMLLSDFAVQRVAFQANVIGGGVEWAIARYGETGAIGFRNPVAWRPLPPPGNQATFPWDKLKSAQ
jgi:hypothetical protein